MINILTFYKNFDGNQQMAIKLDVTEGSKIGRWTVIKFDIPRENWSNPGRMVMCRCECGVGKLVNLSDLKTYKSKSCIDCRFLDRKTWLDRNLNTKHGFLTIVSRDTNNRKRAIVLCDCGVQKSVIYDEIKFAGLNSCGCKTLELRKNTNQERYGVNWTCQDPEIKAKQLQTMYDNYGVTSPQKSSAVREKTKKTVIEKYGVEYATQSKQMKDKSKETNLRLRKVEYPGQCAKVKKKMKTTSIEKYGYDHPLKNPEVKKKQNATNLERYGAEQIMSLPEFKEKANKTKLEKYGAENVFSNKSSIRASIMQSMVDNNSESEGEKELHKTEKCSFNSHI